MDILGLPSFLLFIMAAIAGGLAGVAAGALLQVISRARTAAMPVAFGIVSAVVAVMAAAVIMPPYKQAHLVELEIKQLKANALFAAIFKAHPTAEAELRGKFTEIAKESGGDQGAYKAGMAARQLQETYFDHDLLQASSVSVKNLLVADAVIQRSLANQPEECLKFFHGDMRLDGPVPLETARHELELRAAIVESAATHPSPPPAKLDRHRVAVLLTRGYAAKGYDIEETASLDKVDLLPPAAGCRLATEFREVLASLSDDDAAYIYKGMVVVGEAGEAPQP